MTTSNENQIPTPLEISEFKTALRRGFKSGEKNSGILRWVFVGSRAVGFIPTQWAYELLDFFGRDADLNDVDFHVCSLPVEPPVMITQYSMLPAKRRKAVRSTITK